MFRLIKEYGIRRAVVLYGAASVAAARGWDAMIGDDGYSRQGVWNWRRDLELLKIDVSAVTWSRLERKLGSGVGEGLQLGKAKIRQKKAAARARAARGRASA